MVLSMNMIDCNSLFNYSMNTTIVFGIVIEYVQSVFFY
jgi:hypothetical protein